MKSIITTIKNAPLKIWIWGGILFLFANWLLAVFWSSEPEPLDIKARTLAASQAEQLAPVVGYATTTALIETTSTLLTKRGGYLSNDVMIPSVFMDNMPAWEFGVLQQVRDLARALRSDMSRSQSQSVEDVDLAKAQPQFNIDHRGWMFPAAETEYRKGIALLSSYRTRLADPDDHSAQFYARADNLRDWLYEVEKRMGSLSQRLSASVGKATVNTDLAGDGGARQSTPKPSEQMVQTSWWKIDDVFYEARGSCWALLNFLRAVEIDFADVLEDKHAGASLRQVIRELEATQQSVWSPMILNGSGFGFVANHSLVMANYISRADAAVIDLSELLSKG